MLTKIGMSAHYFTFRERLNYQEHPMYRHIEPPLSFHLELQRLANYETQRVDTENQQIHLYYAESKNTAPSEAHNCFFARVLIRGVPPGSLVSDIEGVVSEAEHVFTEALSAIEVAQGEKQFKVIFSFHSFRK